MGQAYLYGSGGVSKPYAVISVTYPAGSTCTCTNGTKTLTTKDTSGRAIFLIPSAGTWTVKAVSGSKSESKSVSITTNGQIVDVTLTYEHIYGAQWDGTSTTVWTRTDDAANFANPTPYISGLISYSSPFDDRYPWSEMQRVTDAAAGELVSIPKFWYKLTQNGDGMKIQIANTAISGFSVSPAHMNRGDGKGERDVVYIGRYHCGDSAYKSVTGQNPKASITRSDARSAIHNLGSNIWQSDFAMRFTIWLLYIVEFADWNSQAKIGYGCSASGVKANNGQTDSMTYHTGTTARARTTYGYTQYRNIEGLWDNVYDWCDGCYNNSNGLNIILNPNNFSDSANGTSVGTPSDGYPSAFSVKTAGGFPMFIPTEANGDTSTYSCDKWSFNTLMQCVCVGGGYGQSPNRGLFCVDRYSTSDSSGDVGCRLQKLP